MDVEDPVPRKMERRIVREQRKRPTDKDSSEWQFDSRANGCHLLVAKCSLNDKWAFVDCAFDLTEVDVPIAKPKRQRKLKQQPRVEDAQIDFEVKRIEETDDQDEEDDEDEECSAKRCLRPTSNGNRILLSLVFILFTVKLLDPAVFSLLSFSPESIFKSPGLFAANRWSFGMDPVRSVWEVVPLFVHRSSEGRRPRTRRLRMQRVSIASQRLVLSGRKGLREFCVRRSGRAVGQLSVSNGWLCVERRRWHQRLRIVFGRKGLESGNGNADDWRWRHHRGIAAMMMFPVWTMAQPFAFERMCRTVSELFSDVYTLCFQWETRISWMLSFKSSAVYAVHEIISNWEYESNCIQWTKPLLFKPQS